MEERLTTVVRILDKILAAKVDGFSIDYLLQGVVYSSFKRNFSSNRGERGSQRLYINSSRAFTTTYKATRGMLYKHGHMIDMSI